MNKDNVAFDAFNGKALIAMTDDNRLAFHWCHEKDHITRVFTNEETLNVLRFMQQHAHEIEQGVSRCLGIRSDDSDKMFLKMHFGIAEISITAMGSLVLRWKHEEFNSKLTRMLTSDESLSVLRYMQKHNLSV